MKHLQNICLIYPTSVATACSVFDGLVTDLKQRRLRELTLLEVDIRSADNARKRIRAALRTQEPTVFVFLISPTEIISLRDLEDLYRLHKIIMYQADIPEYFDDYYVFISQFADLILIDEILELARYRLHGFSCRFFSAGFDYFCEPVKRIRDIDVAFIGRVDRAGRGDYLSALRGSADFNLYVAGYGCERGPLSRSEMYEIYRRSKIVLNFTGLSTAIPFNTGRKHVNALQRALKGRIFEAMGCGAFVLSERCESFSEIFIEYQHAVQFQSAEDLLDKIRYYLSHEEERENIAAEARKYVEDKYSYKHASMELIEAVQSLPARSDRKRILTRNFSSYLVRAAIANINFGNVKLCVEKIREVFTFSIIPDIFFACSFRLLRIGYRSLKGLVVFSKP